MNNGETGILKSETLQASGTIAEYSERESESVQDTTINFEKVEKEQRASELLKANAELRFQYEEKEKRAAELVIANKELKFQNAEKEKRANELSKANDELRKAEEKIQGYNEDLEQKVKDRTKQLESANKDLESFSYSVSHDLRAPLRAINGYAKILEEDYGNTFDNEGKRLLGIVQSNATKMGVLIDDLLEFSRLGTKKLNKSAVNMQDLVETVMAEQQSVNYTKTAVSIGKLMPASADKSMIKQVWINLISNALKYSGKNKQASIEISSEVCGTECIYSIHDNGVGFDMKYAEKLFGVFQRLHAAEEFEGTGVGLALVQRIIRKHEGKVWANAECGKGATFYFSLPVQQK